MANIFFSSEFSVLTIGAHTGKKQVQLFSHNDAMKAIFFRQYESEHEFDVSGLDKLIEQHMREYGLCTVRMRLEIYSTGRKPTVQTVNGDDVPVAPEYIYVVYREGHSGERLRAEEYAKEHFLISEGDLCVAYVEEDEELKIPVYTEDGGQVNFEIVSKKDGNAYSSGIIAGRNIEPGLQEVTLEHRYLEKNDDTSLHIIATMYGRRKDFLYCSEKVMSQMAGRRAPEGWTMIKWRDRWNRERRINVAAVISRAPSAETETGYYRGREIALAAFDTSERTMKIKGLTKPEADELSYLVLSRDVMIAEPGKEPVRVNVKEVSGDIKSSQSELLELKIGYVVL